MKQKKYTVMLGITVLMVGLFFACKRTEGADPSAISAKLSMSVSPGKNNGPSVNKGWLQFKDMAAFNSTMELLQGRYDKSEKLQDWEDQFKGLGYTSLRKHYSDIDADTSEKRTAPTVDSLINSNRLLDCPDSWFATVLSKDGLIQVADTVYSFRPGNKNGEAYAIPDRYSEQIDNRTILTGLKGVKVHFTSFLKIPFVRWGEVGDGRIGPPKVSICINASNPMANFWGQSGGDIYAGDNGDTFPEHNGRTVKMNYHRWRVGYIFYASAGVRMKMLKHTRFAGWQSVTYADQMTMEACCKGLAATAGVIPYPFTSSTSPAWPGFTRYAENSFEKTLKWVGSPIFSEILLYHFNFHWKLNYRGRVAERTIIQ